MNPRLRGVKVGRKGAGLVLPTPGQHGKPLRMAAPAKRSHRGRGHADRTGLGERSGVSSQQRLPDLQTDARSCPSPTLPACPPPTWYFTS